MYKLSPETLNEERLKGAVDQETYNLGQELFARGQVQVNQVTDLIASCDVWDKRRYQVQLKIAQRHIYFKCTCRHAGRGLICEHDVAAWLAIRKHLLNRQPSMWQVHLNKVADAVRITPQRNLQKPYLLFFSLQEDQFATPNSWRILAYQLSTTALPNELRRADNTWDATAIRQFIETHSRELSLQLRSLYRSLDPGSCQNCPPQGVKLANLLFERARAYERDVFGFPFEDVLGLVATIGCPLYLGDFHHPLQKELDIMAEDGEARLTLVRVENGLRLSVQLSVANQIMGFDKDEIQYLEGASTWVLADRYLFRLNSTAAVNLLYAFKNTPEIVVPEEQVQIFLDKHYLELARRIPLGGDMVIWEEITEMPMPRLYLNETNGELQGQLRFGYGSVEVSYDGSLSRETIHRKADSWTLIKVQRDIDTEKAAFEMLSSATYGLKRAPLPAQPGLFRLRARTHPVDFLLNGLPRLARDGFEIYGEEQLKTARVNRNTPTISFNVSSGIDWFDVQAVVNYGDLEVSLKDIRRVIRKKERYIKLVDGSIGEIPEEWFERYKHLFEFAELSGESLRLSRQHLTLIDESLVTADKASVDAGFEQRRSRLRAMMEAGVRGISIVDLPKGLNGELRPYQKAGYDWLHFLHEFDYGGCLADDMGLGKTVQALAFLQSIYEGRPGFPRSAQASLLVVPRSLLVNWQREAARFTPGLRILEFFHSNRSKDAEAFNQADLVITTFGVMLRDIQFLHGFTFYYAILDESQTIKNPLSQTARAAHLLQAQHRLVLTGTPIENSTGELWSQFAFLNPGLLGNLNYFKKEFGTPIEKRGDEETAIKLRKLVNPFILRRTKDQVAPELPPRSERILYSDMEPAQRKLYNRTRDAYRGLLLGMLETEGLNYSRMKILEGLLRLRQISNHPILVDEKFRGESGKFELLLDTLETLRAEKHKALVFSQFVQMLSLVRKEMEKREMRYTYLDGQTQNRQEQVDVFQADPSIPFFLISLKAGGLGLNLTAADYVIHIDPWWNPAVEMQASDRTHRIGQDKPVFVFKLIARDSVEEKILVLQERKRNLVDQIITTESSFFKSITEEDIKLLLS